MAHNFMEILGSRSVFCLPWGIGKTALKELWVVTLIYHLCMKFPTKQGIDTVKNDQQSARECYSSSIQRVEPMSVNVILMEFDEVDNLAERKDVYIIDASEEEATMEIQLGPKERRLTDEASHINDLDPRIINDKPQTISMEELESFEVG